MHPQFYRFVIGLRKAEVKPNTGARGIIAETLVRVARQTTNREVQEALLAEFLSKELLEAFKYAKLDISKVAEAKLVVDDETTYDQIDHVLAVCCNVAFSSASVMEQLTAAFSDNTYWGAWMVLQDFDGDSLKAACELYVPAAKRNLGSSDWRQQHDTMGKINPPRPAAEVVAG